MNNKTQDSKGNGASIFESSSSTGGDPSRRQVIRWSAIGLGTLAVAPVLAACGSDDDKGGGSAGASTGKLVVLDSGTQTTTKPKDQTYKDFTGKNPKITFDIRALPSDTGWDQQARTAIQSGDDVDLLNINGQFIRAWVRDGLLEDLGEIAGLSAAVSRVSKESLGAGSVDGKNYALPLAQSGGQHTTVLYFNKKLLDQAGLAEPKTIDDLKAMVDPLKALGASPLIHPAGDTFQCPLLMMWILPLVLGSKDPIEFVTDTQKGDVKYTSSEWVDAFSTIADLTTSGVMLPGSASIKSDAVTQYLSSGKAATIYNGTWLIPTMKPTSKFDPHITGLPTLGGDSRGRPIAAYVGYGIPKGTKRGPAVAKFLDYASSAEVDRAITAETQAFSPVADSNSAISGALAKEAVPFFDGAIAPMDWLWEPEIASEFGNQIQGVVKGSIKPADAAKKIESTMEGLRSSGRAYYK